MTKKALAAATVLAAALPLAACGSIDGTYNTEIDGIEANLTIEGDTCDLELKKGDETREAECSIDTDNKTLTVQGEESDYEHKGDKLILKGGGNNGDDLEMKKQ